MKTKDRRERECGRKFPHTHRGPRNGRPDCPLKKMVDLVVEPFGDRVREPFPYVIAKPNGDIVAYCLDEWTAEAFASALNFVGGIEQ